MSPPRDLVQLHSSRTEQEYNKATKTTVMVPIGTTGNERVKITQIIEEISILSEKSINHVENVKL